MSDLLIVLTGLPSTGKTVLFNLITDQAAAAATPHPDPTGKPVRSVVTIHDERIHRIAALIKPAALAQLQVDIVDVPGIVTDQSGSGSNIQESLNSLRQADVVAQVVRGFSSPDIPALFEGINYGRDICALESELLHADLATLQREIQKIEKLQAGGNLSRLGELAVFQQAAALLEAGHPLRAGSWSQEALALFKQINLITHRPQFYVINYGEDELDTFTSSAAAEKISRDASIEGSADVVIGTICGQLEYELAQLSEAEREDLQQLYPNLQLAKSLFPWWALRALNMVTYFTFGHLGLKEWAIASGSTALVAARRLHSDIAKGLIATEVFTTEELLHHGSAEEVKRQGKVRLEGRDYQIQDGDILYFRFSK